MKFPKKIMFLRDVAYIPLPKEHAEHLGVSKEEPHIIIEDFVKTKGTFIAVYKNNKPKE